MSPLIVSAQFAAYIWFTEQEHNVDRTRNEAMQFTRTHWKDFLALADKGLGRLLLRMADLPERRARRRRLSRTVCATVPAGNAGHLPFSCN